MSGLPLFLLVRLALLSTAAVSPSVASDAKAIGFVLQEAGAWTADGKPLHRYDQLTPGSVVKVAAPGRPGERQRIVILLNDGHTRACDGAEDCRDPIALPQSLEAGPSFFERVAALFQAGRERFEATLSRGEGAQLDDAVVRDAAGSADLTSVLAPLGGNDYEVAETSLDDGSTRSLTLHRSPSGGVSAPLGFGLHSLTVSAPGAAAPLAPDVWVLAVGSARYDAVARQFTAARATTQTWPPAAGDDARRSFLRAALQALDTAK